MGKHHKFHKSLTQHLWSFDNQLSTEVGGGGLKRKFWSTLKYFRGTVAVWLKHESMIKPNRNKGHDWGPTMTDFVDYGYVWKLWLPYCTTGLTSYLQLDFKLDFDFSHTCDFEDTNIFKMGLAILMLDAYWKKSSKSLSKFLAFIALKLHS